MGIGMCRFLIWVLYTLYLTFPSLGFVPVDNYLIDCGSPTNTTVGDRVFLADELNSSLLSTPQTIFVNATLKPISSTFDSALYQNARILNGTSHYTFSIHKKGRLWIRLYFFPFADGNHNLNRAKFSVSAQHFTLLRDFQPQNDSVVKEYSLNIGSDSLVLTFTPSANSFSFINAIEVFSLPDELIPDGAITIYSPAQNQILTNQALETVARVNMGNQTVYPQNDTLWRLWVSDETYLNHVGLVKFVSNITALNYSRELPAWDFAPSSVYGTATRLDSQSDSRTKANVTWSFSVDPGFEYLVRLQFCDIVSTAPEKLFFNVYIDSLLLVMNLDLSSRTSNRLGIPYHTDVVTRSSNNPSLNVSIEPSSSVHYTDPDGILNGLEIMKLSNSKSSLAASDSKEVSSKLKVWVIVGVAIGVSCIAFLLALFLFIVCRRKRRSSPVGHSTEDHFDIAQNMENKYSSGTAIFSRSKIGYCFPFVAIQQATDNFSESLVIGVGGFGKVYKGVLGDGTTVAVKRGISESRQGFAEFRTEIDMLSQFHHRHLVSLIGYCHEQKEMIIIYEYMENGTLKDHLYGSDLPGLSWRHRLEICIGSARGLHYLHTGSTKPIIHRDVKSANILLDENLMAKVADFGLSKTGPEIDETHVSTAVKGSFGYLDPEYLMTQQLTEKSDVYSFGVVMFEVLCGRPIINPSLHRKVVNLIEWAMEFEKRGELEKIIDPHLRGKVKQESLQKFGETAVKCLAECGIDRPTIGDVLWNLECALQLQANDETPNLHGDLPSEVDNNVSHFDAGVSTTEVSTGRVGDLAGVSMSGVFSQMVKAETKWTDMA